LLTYSCVVAWDRCSGVNKEKSGYNAVFIWVHYNISILLAGWNVLAQSNAINIGVGQKLVSGGCALVVVVIHTTK